MSIENAKAFLKRISNDEELRDKLGAAAGKEERIEVARAEGFDCTEDEWKEACAGLSDEELSAIAGGYGCSKNDLACSIMNLS